MFKWFKKLFGFKDEKLVLANKLAQPVKRQFKDKKPHSKTQNEQRLEKLAETWFHLGGGAEIIRYQGLYYEGQPGGTGGYAELPSGYNGEDGGLGCGCPGQNGGYQPNQARLDTSNPPGNPPKKL